MLYNMVIITEKYEGLEMVKKKAMSGHREAHAEFQSHVLQTLPTFQNS